MSGFLHPAYQSLTPYVPGEQPRGRALIKLNTNESPFPPPAPVLEAAAQAMRGAHRYCDPACTGLRQAAAAVLGVTEDRVLCANGSDEALSLAFQAYGQRGASFPDITYGFYPIFAAVHGVKAFPVPLGEDFRIDVRDYLGLDRLIVLANPNAPTGLALPVEAIGQVAAANPGAVVVVDEAYVDFGARSAVGLTDRYENLLVVRTFSKSHALAGARIGFAVGHSALIRDLDTLRNAVNPYNVSAMAQAAGTAALENQPYFMAQCRRIQSIRDRVKQALRDMGFHVLDSSANFLFARHERVGGETLYRKLKEKDVLVRWFPGERTGDFIRVSIGDEGEMAAFAARLTQVLEETA